MTTLVSRTAETLAAGASRSASRTSTYVPKSSQRDQGESRRGLAPHRPDSSRACDDRPVHDRGPDQDELDVRDRSSVLEPLLVHERVARDEHGGREGERDAASVGRIVATPTPQTRRIPTSLRPRRRSGRWTSGCPGSRPPRAEPAPARCRARRDRRGRRPPRGRPPRGTQNIRARGRRRRRCTAPRRSRRATSAPPPGRRRSRRSGASARPPPPAPSMAEEDVATGMKPGGREGEQERRCSTGQPYAGSSGG